MRAPAPPTVPPFAGWRAEAARLWTLGWPVSLGSLGIVSMYVVDNMMVGHLGKQELAAVAIGNLWISAFGLVGRSVINGLDPVVAQAFGANDHEEAGDALLRAAQVALLVAVPVIAIYQVAGWGLGLLGQPSALLPQAGAYVRAVSFGVVPMLLFWALRQWLQGLGLMRPATWVLLAANLVNAVLDFVMIYGLPGRPGLGVLGCGYATSISQLFTIVALAWLVRHEVAAWWPKRPRWRDLEPLGAALALGLPVALQLALEVWAFTGASVMMGWLGSTQVAAHAVALNLASLAFMIPLGLSAAATTRVGNLLGAGFRWQSSAWIAVALGAGSMILSGTLFFVVPGSIARLYTADAGVIALASGLLPMAAVFGLFDGTQVVCFGILRGVGDVRVPSLFNVVAYWLVGLPLGGWLAFHTSLGPYGIWAGLVIALMTVAMLLLFRVRATGRRGGRRVGRRAHQATPS